MKPVIEVTTPCIIIPARTGVVYHNQVGGYACHQINVEGYIIPLSKVFYVKVKEGGMSNNANPYWNTYDFQEYFDTLFAPLEKKTKYNGHGYEGIDLQDVKYVEKAFANSEDVELKVDRKLLKKCEEAKVFVNVTIRQYDEHCKETKPLVRKGILTWENSD